MSWLERIDLPTILLAAGMALAAFILLRRLWGRSAQRSKTSNRQKPPAPTVRLQPLIDAPDSVTRWQVEMHDLAREMKAELDTKMIALQSLVARSREATQQLEAAVERAEKLGLRTESGRDVLAEMAGVEDTPPTQDFAAQNFAPPSSPDDRIERLRQMNQQSVIFHLADEGHSPVGIAHQTGLAVGDVELTLSLRGDDE